MPVNSAHSEYENMYKKWEKCRDCREGSDAVKAKGRNYLPTLDVHESNAAGYERYKTQAYFYAVMRRTVDGLAGMIFQKPPLVTFPDQYKAFTEDVTLTGKPFDSLALFSVQEVLTVGRVGILVDMATDPAPEKRPYAVCFRAEDIISWRAERKGGDEILTRVVLREKVETVDPEDPFALIPSTRFRVCELVDEQYSQTIWVPDERETGKYILSETLPISRRGTALDFIPFVFIGPTSISPNVDEPPLDALADTNLAHYCNSADYEHGLSLTGRPVPWISGQQLGKDEKIPWGPTQALNLAKDGKAGILQADGKMLGALRDAMDRKEKIMAVQGARLLEEQPKGAETAMAVSMRHAGEHASLRTIAQTSGQGLTRILQWLAWWEGTEVRSEDVDASCELNKEFFALRLTAQELQALVTAHESEGMSWSTLFYNMQRGGLFPPDRTPEEEKAEIERESPDEITPTIPEE